jgi:hypothetical protein
MSFDVFVRCYQNGEFAGLTRQRVREAFGNHLLETEANIWKLHYDDTNFCELYLTSYEADTSMVQGFTVNRSCGDERLWDALASMLAIGNVVLYFPGGRAPLVGRSSTIQHLPPDMIAKLGQPKVVKRGSEILHEIRSA